MKYSVRYTAQAIKELKKLDKHTSSLILGWIQKNLIDCENPRQHGKGLAANHNVKWRYRVGNYRIIADIQDNNIVILILTIGHRKDIY